MARECHSHFEIRRSLSMDHHSESIGVEVLLVQEFLAPLMHPCSSWCEKINKVNNCRRNQGFRQEFRDRLKTFILRICSSFPSLFWDNIFNIVIQRQPSIKSLLLSHALDLIWLTHTFINKLWPNNPCNWRSQEASSSKMYCLQYMVPVLMLPKPLNPTLLQNHVMMVILYLMGYFLERKPCTICTIIFLAAVLLFCVSGFGNCILSLTPVCGNDWFYGHLEKNGDKWSTKLQHINITSSRETPSQVLNKSRYTICLEISVSPFYDLRVTENFKNKYFIEKRHLCQLWIIVIKIWTRFIHSLLNPFLR